MNSCDQVNTKQNDKYCHRSSLLSISYNLTIPLLHASHSSQECVCQDVYDSDASWNTTSYQSERDDQFSSKSKANVSTTCKKEFEVETTCSNKLLCNDIVLQDVPALFLTDIDVFSTESTTNNVQDQSFANEMNYIENTQVVCSVHISESKSFDNFAYRTNYTRNCHSAVPYLSLKKNQFIINGLCDKYNCFRSDYKEQKKSICYSFPNYNKTVSPLSLLEKYIYIEKPFTSLSLNCLDNIEKQVFECCMISTTHKNCSNLEKENTTNEEPPRVSSTDSQMKRRKHEDMTHFSFQQDAELGSTSDISTNSLDNDVIQRPLPIYISQNHNSEETSENWFLINCNGQEIICNDVLASIEKYSAHPVTEQKAKCLKPLRFLSCGTQTHQSGDVPLETARNEALIICHKNYSKPQTNTQEMEKQNGNVFLCNDCDLITWSQYENVKNESLSKDVQGCARNMEKEIFGDIDFKNIEVSLSSGQKCQENYTCESTILERIFPTTFIQYTTLILKEIFKDLSNIKNIIMQSEISVKETIAEYVKDKNLEMKLMEVLQNCKQNQDTSEQRLHSIALRLIEEQMQIIKNYKESSQTHIETLISQKCVLEQENLLLLKKFEQTCEKLKQSLDGEMYPQECNCILLENNEKLRNKLEMVQHQISELQIMHQEILRSLERSVDEVHRQNLEIENQKMMLIRHQNNFKVEKAYLYNEIEKYNQSLKEVRGVVDTIVEELKKLKNNMEETGQKVGVKWERLKVENTTISRVLVECHLCISELGLELASIYQELMAKDKDLSTTKESNEQLQCVLNKLETEYNMLRQQSEHVINEKMNMKKQLLKLSQENSNLKEQLLKNSQNTKVLEMEIIKMQELKTAAKEQEIIKSQLEKCIEDLKTDKENMTKQLISDENTGRTMEVDLMKMTALLDMYETKNRELIKINQDHEKELLEQQKSLLNLQKFPERYEQLENNYYKEIAEKDYMSEQINILKTQLTEFSIFKSTYSKQLQTLETELKKASKENLETKWELKNLKNINQCLEQDNCNMLHHLEEETERYKNQINESNSKTQDLQNQIEAREKENEEVKKMFIIQTETLYSLQQECEEKKVTIKKLEDRCQDLNTLQQKNEQQITILNNKINDLENEIITVSKSNTSTLNSIKYEFQALENTLKITQDDLNNSIIKLQEKEATLTSLQEDLQRAEQGLFEKEHKIAEDTRTIKILQKDVQDMNNIKNSYCEMQELLKDYKKTFAERDKLKIDQANLQLEFETLQKTVKELQNKNNILIKYSSLQKEHIKGMKVQINKLHDYLTNGGNRENIDVDLHQVTYELTLHNNKAADLEFEIEEYKFILDEKQNGNEEKCRLQSQVILLHELHKRNSTDLSQARKTIKIQEDKISELMAQLNEEVCKQRNTEKELESTVKQHELFMTEMKNLQEQVQLEAHNCLSLTEEYYNYQKEMEEKEATFLSNIQELKNENETLKEEMKVTRREKEDLHQIIENKQKEEVFLKEKNEEIELRLSDYGRTLSHLVQEKRKNEQLQNQIDILTNEGHNLMQLQKLLQSQHGDITTSLQESRNELKRTREALGALEQLEGQHVKELFNIKNNYANESSHYLEDIKLLKEDKTKSEQSINELQKTEQCLLREKKDLSNKLLKALKIIHKTKEKFFLVIKKVHELSIQIKCLHEQKAMKEEEVKTLSAEIAMLNSQTKHKKDGNENKLSEHKLQECISSLERQVDDLQSQLLKAKQRIENDNSKIEALLIIKEDTIMQYKEQINLLQEKSNRLHSGLAEAQNKLLQHNQNQNKLKRDIVTLQADKRQLSLQLQMTEAYYNEEKQHRIHLEDIYNKLLGKHTSIS